MIKQSKDILKLIDEAKKIVENEEIDLNSLNQMLSRQVLLPYSEWKNDKPYTRVCLHENQEFELILICWKAFAKTAIHNHNEQNCWVFFFDSDFEEVIYCEKGKESLNVNSVHKGGTSFMKEGNKCHTLQNLSNKPAMSLHLYNRPIKTCEIVKQPDKEASLDWAVLEYDTKLTFEYDTSITN